MKKRTTLFATTAMAALAVAAFATAPALASGPKLGTTPAVTSTSTNAAQALYGLTSKYTILELTAANIDGGGISAVVKTPVTPDVVAAVGITFGASKSLVIAKDYYMPATKQFMATETTQGGPDTGKKKVQGADWAAVLGTSAGFKKADKWAAVGTRDQLLDVAIIDNAKQPAPVAFHTAASRGMFAA